jgi:hypothetical protein
MTGRKPTNALRARIVLACAERVMVVAMICLETRQPMREAAEHLDLCAT